VVRCRDVWCTEGAKTDRGDWNWRILLVVDQEIEIFNSIR